MKLDIPYYSQKVDVADSKWKGRACGITCLKMMLDFYRNDIPSLDKLIEHGIIIEAYRKSGWVHRGLVEIADYFGMTIESREFKLDNYKQSSAEEGIRQMIESLKNGIPVLVSAVKQFKYSDKFHMVILVGFEENEENLKGFYYHDPDANTTKEGENLFVSMGTFRKYWRKMAIFVKRFD